MIDRNTATYDAHSHQTTILAMAARAVAGLTTRSEARACSLPGIGRSAPPNSASAAGWQVREEPEDYTFDFLSDEDHEAGPELSAAADAHTEGLREAQRLLDEAVNLVTVLMASMEQEGDARAMQADTVLKIVDKKLNKAHTRIDRQQSRHRKLFLAYFDLKVRSEKGSHGFAVDEDTLPDNIETTHRSLFDGTLQGIALKDRPAFGFQGHPEASPGPHDLLPLFERFIASMEQAKKSSPVAAFGFQ